MQAIEMLSSALGLLGAILLASRSRFAGWAFAAWLLSNVGWLVFGAGHNHWFFFAQQIGFTATSLLGVWTWLIHPALRRAETAEESLAARDLRAKDAIEWALDIDYVDLVQTPRVLHTSAPVTYDCLRHIFILAEEQGRALERERTGAPS